MPLIPTSVAFGEAVDIGSRLELFVDHYLIDSMNELDLKLHHPEVSAGASSPLPIRHARTVIKDSDALGDLYRAYWRATYPGYTGPTYSGHPGETTYYAESRDGHEWTFPNLGLYEVGGTYNNNAVLAGQPPFSHNFTPFLDTRPDVDPNERYKAIAGYPGEGDKSGLPPEQLVGRGLFSFVSPDGINWTKKEEIIPYQPGWEHAFDSQNVAFWSEAEQQYVSYIRTWTDPGGLRTISRTTSPDFVNWTVPVEMNPNLPGEHLYTNGTHPYFRAPHIYIATPTRFVPASAPGADNPTYILFMTSRAGITHYDRTFTKTFIRPGLDPVQLGDRSNYVALNVVPTGYREMSIYHRSGDRYVLRTDGFISANAGTEEGELLTKPLIFSGNDLIVNFITESLGNLRVEIQTENGAPIPGFTLADSNALTGDAIERSVTWSGGSDLGSLAGLPVRIRFVLQEADLYSFQFKLKGDVNGDGFVGISDLNKLLSNWNASVPVGDRSQGDIAGNGDGFIGISDLNVILSNWNNGTLPPVSLPEPSTAAFFMIICAVFLSRGESPCPH